MNVWELTKAFILAKKCPHACLDQFKKKMPVKEERNVDSFIFFRSLPLCGGRGDTRKGKLICKRLLEKSSIR